jgi:hypothetical protein
MNADQLNHYINKIIIKAGENFGVISIHSSYDEYGFYYPGYSLNQINTRVKYASPTQRNFTIRGSKIPVTDKTGPDHDKLTVKVEPSIVRYQNNMR